MNGYNFTERVRRALARARTEAVALHHEYVGTEHILLGLIHEDGSIGSTVLDKLKADRKMLRATIHDIVQVGKTNTKREDLPYTSRAKKVLELSMSEAREHDHPYVGTEHVLMGLLLEAKGVAAQVLNAADVTVPKARAMMLRLLEESGRTSGPAVAVTSPTAERETPLANPPMTERLRSIMHDAYAVAAARGSTHLTPVHVMIALLKHGEGAANVALERAGVDRQQVLRALDELAPAGTKPLGPEDTILPSPELSSVLTEMDATQRHSNAPVSATQHLLVALMLTSREVAGVLRSQGVLLSAIQDELRKMSG
jgi:ATP-dependent Clp protease ATP-binding subunit ClpA